MREKAIASGLLLCMNLGSSSACLGEGFKAMARELSAAARRARIDRVAILPFSPVNGAESGGGRAISERLTTQVVRAGKVGAVERSLLSGLMDEQRLERTGMIDPRTLRQLGRILAADGIVTGSFADAGARTVIDARLIDAETGVILAAVEREVDKDWLEPSPFGDFERNVAALRDPDSELIADHPSPPAGDSDDLRDAPAEDSCSGASERIDRFERDILDAKARYWAARLRDGASLAGVTVNPGSTITDPILKKAFYDRVRYYYEQDRPPALTTPELRRFFSTDAKAYALYRACEP